MRALVALILGVCLSDVVAVAQAPQKRVALVIANSKYTAVPALKNTTNDAYAVAGALKTVGFTNPIVKTDLSKQELERALLAFGAEAAKADVALIYYAGHGMEVDGNNYLIPIDAKLANAEDIDLEAVRAEVAIRQAKRAQRINIVILDACRNNPFVPKIKAAGGTRAIGERGLAAVEPGGETLLAFAAKAGSTADDGTGDNSPFAQALVKRIKEDGVEIRLMFGRIRDDVLTATKGKQEPFVYGSLGGREFYFKPGTAKPAPVARAIGPDPAIGKKPGESFRDCSECPEMVIVPAGKFVMGSPENEKGRKPFEGPQHEVKISKPFAVGKFEVTSDQWDACLEAGGCYESLQPNPLGLGKIPLAARSWHEAQGYIAWINRISGRTYRLLSEAEWEYVARAGTTTIFPWGNEIGVGNTNCAGCGSRWDLKEPAPVGSFRPNGFGVYDMDGNVSEWVEDCWNVDYLGAPANGAARETGECRRRVVRGGSWHLNPGSVRSASRSWAMAHEHRDYIGFRVARVISH